MVQQQVFFQSVSFANNLVLRAENLACARGARKVFAQLDFQLKAGEAMAVYGANGSGKTSLLRLIAGFLTPRDGALCLSGDGHEATQCHYLGHTNGLKANLTVAETLSFTARILSIFNKTFPCLYIQIIGGSRLFLPSVDGLSTDR